MEANFDFTISELFEMLNNDESWEPDEALRAEYANGLFISVISCT